MCLRKKYLQTKSNQLDFLTAQINIWRPQFILHTFTELIIIMKGTHLGEFEELVLLTVASLVDDAYSVAICDELSKHAKRSVKLGVVHSVLNRLEEKGLVKSKLGEATASRGGKRKRFYVVTGAGKASLVRAKEIRDQLWQKIPSLIIKTN